MKRTAIKATHSADSFQSGRIKAIQPEMASADLAQPVMQTEDPVAISFMTNLLRIWSFERHDLPPDFVDEVELTQLTRQPIAIVRVQVEMTSAKLENHFEPFTDQKVNDNAWPSTDVFEIRPLKIGKFPAQPLKERVRLSGQESVGTCNQCNSAGEVPCTNCDGGRVTCPDCGGTRQLICPRCGGGGIHEGVSGKLINCQLCGTRGTRRCNLCDRGQVLCSTCSGSSLLTCSQCNGAGNLLHFWIQNTVISSEEHSVGLIGEDWPVDIKCLESESTIFHVEQWNWPIVNSPGTPIQDWVPQHLHGMVKEALDDQLSKCSRDLEESERVSAVRVKLLGVFLYAVDYSYFDEPSRVYVGGLRNRVFSKRQTQKKKGLFSRVKRLGYHITNTISNYTPPVDKKYLAAIRQGQVHIGDTRCLIPAVAKAMIATADITESGYDIEVKLPRNVSFQLKFDFNSAGKAVLCFQLDLCKAERQRFSQAMEFNKRLAFGRIAVVNTEFGEMFSMVDRREYGTARPEQLVKIIRGLIADCDEIIDAKFLF